MTSAADLAPAARLRSWVATCAPAILFGLRLSAAVSAALFIAFTLQLENPSWAGTSAGIVCQPVLGASLRKGVFRLLGTVVGAVATVLLTACFPQDRVGFLVGMALWCGACSLVSTLLRNFAAYAAMLAGYTMAIIASSSIAAPDQVFTLALSRATEIEVGIVCGMVVMSLTDLGRSGKLLGAEIAGLVAEIGSGVLAQIDRPGTRDEPFRERRRALIKRVAVLDPLLDRTLGESPAASEGRTTVRAGIQGLFLALSAWRTLGVQLTRLPSEEAREEARLLREHLPAWIAARPDPPWPDASGDTDSMAARAEDCFARAQACRDREVSTPSLRLGADRLASFLYGVGQAANAAVLLGGRRARPLRAVPRNLVPDLLPPVVNAVRVMVAVGGAALFYVATAWPDGPTFITFLAVTVILLSPQDEGALSAAVGFGAGMVLTAAVAGAVKFAVLPNHESFASFALLIGLALVPMAALSTVPKLSPVFVAAATNFIPLLGPSNQITYDTLGFDNTALAIVGGSVAGAVVLRIIPPVRPRVRAARLLGLTLRDLRRLAKNPDRWHADQWRARVYGRLLALPAAAEPVDGSRLLAALTVGLQVIDLRAAAREPAAASLVGSMGASLASGNVGATRRALDHLYDAIVTWPADVTQSARLRLQGAAREISDMLATYDDYFGAELR